MAAKPGFVSEIGNRNALVDAANHALDDTVALAGGQTRIAHLFRNIQRQIKGWQNQLNSFVPWIIRAVAIPDIGRRETAHRPAQHILNGVQFIDCFIDENFVHVALHRPFRNYGG